MSNMSYCRWQNTSSDLKACLNDMEEFCYGGGTIEEYADNLSEEEKKAFFTLLKQAGELVARYEEENS